MSQYLEFAGNHPLLMAALVLVIAVLVMNEFRRKLLGFKELSVNEAVRLINHDDALALDVRLRGLRNRRLSRRILSSIFQKAL